MIRTVKTDLLTAVGSNGSAAISGKTKVPVSGQLMGVRVVQGNTPSATVTITDDDGQTLLTLSGNSETDKWYYPRVLTQDAADGTDLTDVYDKFPVDGYLNVAISSGNSGQTGTFTFKVWQDD